MKAKRFWAILLSVILVLGTVPVTTVLAASTPAYTTEYVKVNSVDEIVPNARYIIVGTYTDANGVETYHAMGKDNYRNHGLRYSYAQEQNGTHHFDISEDKSKITVYSYETYDPILRIRIKPRDNEGRFYLQVDGEGYLCGYSDSTSDGANGHDFHSCLPISNRTVGEVWWYMRLPTTGDYAGEWQIVNRSRLANYSGYYYDAIMMRAPYPNSAGQFRAEPVYREDVGEMDEAEYIKYTVDANTNILLYREVCAHRDEEVTHRESAAACDKPGTLSHWYCAGCCKYFSDADRTKEIEVGDVFLPPLAHTDSCGHPAVELRFERSDAPNGSNQSGERYLLIGRAGDKYYAMGNLTNEDGSRNAVEVTPDARGIITASSHREELLTYYWPESGPIGFLADNGYLSVTGGRIVSYEQSLYGTSGHIPYPARFSMEDYDTKAGYFYADSSFNGEDEYIVFDAEALCFRSQSERSGATYLYRELCPHEKIYYPAVEATCDRCGTPEYWVCDTCWKTFGAEDGSITLDENQLMIHASGHEYADGACLNCSKKVPVYNKVTSEDQLGLPGTYIIVATDGTNTYVMQAPVDRWADLNNNGIPDMEEIDLDNNGVPDIYETDSDGDGIVDGDDYDPAPLVLQVVPNADGSISVPGLGAAEFEMISLDTIEGGGEVPMRETAEGDVWEGDILAGSSEQYFLWIPNGLLNGQNEPNLRGSCFINGEGFQYADETCLWGISLGNGLTETEALELANAKFTVGDDTAILYAENCGTGATRPLRLRLFEGVLSFVTEYDGFLPGAEAVLDGDGNLTYDENGNIIYNTYDTQFGVYLYYAPNEYAHTHQWSDWTPDENGLTHTRTCSAEGCTVETETKAHEWSDWDTDGTYHRRSCDVCQLEEEHEHQWDEGETLSEPTCTEPGSKLLTCGICEYEKTEPIPATEHKWGDWIPDEGGLTHTRTCPKEDCPVKTETQPHAWSDWVSNGNDTHTRRCPCTAVENGDCDFNEGTVELRATDNSILLVQSCTVCGFEKETVLSGTVVSFVDCEGLNENPLIFLPEEQETTFTLTLPKTEDVAQRDGYRLIGWTASIDGVTYAVGAELTVAYADAASIIFRAEWAEVLGEGEQKLAEDRAYVTDMEAFTLAGEDVTYCGDRVFYVPKDGLYTLINVKNEGEVE